MLERNKPKFEYGDVVRLSPIGLKHARNYHNIKWSLRKGVVQKHKGITVPVIWFDSDTRRSTYYHPSYLEIVR